VASYDTPLSSRDEVAFQIWAQNQRNAAGGKAINDLPVYDVRGLYLAVGGRTLKAGQHGTDRFKKPTHPTFSNESMYHSLTTPGGRWGNENGQPTFYATPFNVNTLGGPEAYQRKFLEETGGNVKLVMPPQ
jgi:hypothetical protein